MIFSSKLLVFYQLIMSLIIVIFKMKLIQILLLNLLIDLTIVLLHQLNYYILQFIELIPCSFNF